MFTKTLEAYEGVTGNDGHSEAGGGTLLLRTHCKEEAGPSPVLFKRQLKEEASTSACGQEV